MSSDMSRSDCLEPLSGQRNHQVNVPRISNHQHVLHDIRQVNMVRASTDPLVVAQEHQAVAEARNDAFQYACQVQSHAQAFAAHLHSQANDFVQGRTQEIRNNAHGVEWNAKSCCFVRG